MKYQFNGTDSEDFCHAIQMIYKARIVDLCFSGTGFFKS